jgi:hypothetical protein
MTMLELSELLGNFGEFFGAILVGASLFYLAVQVRNNTNSTDEANMRAEAERIAGFCSVTVGVPGFMEIFLKAQNGEELSPVEQMKFNTHMFAMFVEFRLEFRLNQRRTTSTLDFETNNRNNISYLLQPGGRSWWEHQKHWLGKDDEDFVQHVNAELVKNDSEA